MSTSLFEQSAAVISDDGLFRYRLSRTWDASLPVVCWVLLNPSTADAERDDPTVRRIRGFSQSWGFGGFVVVNLFAFRATNPKALMGVPDPIGPDNDAAIDAETSDRVTVVAWGTFGKINDRGRDVLRRLAGRGRGVQCLGVTGTGQPVHPLYVPGDREMRTFDGVLLR